MSDVAACLEYALIPLYHFARKAVSTLQTSVGSKLYLWFYKLFRVFRVSRGLFFLEIDT